MRVSNEDGIYASEAVLREPLYGGVQKTLPDVYYDRSGDNKSNQQPHETRKLLGVANLSSPSFPRILATAEVLPYQIDLVSEIMSRRQTSSDMTHPLVLTPSGV